MPSVFSRRASWSLVPNRPHQVRLTLEAAGRPLLDLTRTNTTRLGFPYPRESLAAALSGEGIHRYDPDPSGSRRARGVLAAHLSRDRQAIDPDHIVLFSSTSEAYGCLFRVLADPGDTVLQPRPGYPLFEHLTRLDALKLESYDLAYCGGWHLQQESLDAALIRAPRAVMVVNPNNPTGNYLDAGHWARLTEGCQEHRIPIISDEVFFEFALDADRQVSGLDVKPGPGLIFVLGGLSKWAGLPQLKLSWVVLVGGDAVVSEARSRLEIVNDAYLSLGTPVQEALPEIIRHSGITRNAILHRIRANIARIRDLLAGSPVSLLEAEGGWSAVLRVPRLQTDEELCIRLLEETGLIVHPGYFYEFRDEGFLVLSLLVPEQELAEGVERIMSRFLEA